MSLCKPMDPKELFTLLRSNANDFELIDIRNSDDYLKFHIPCSISLPSDSKEFLNFIPSKKTGIFYCQSSSRTIYCQDDLEDFEFENAYTLIGGISYWRQLDLPLCIKECDQVCLCSLEEVQLKRCLSKM